ncbi:hypothetical protein QYE76_065962 [Lolium multiflorum]|uniref:Uncharacterized protein n=1 Tax=Lolium multiflorum TaxID=4521 RepID=A0AAD8S9R1_LOLMU|nr:hypothetical protein QYE76_065962 [Lolium multiflorum]
MVKKKSLTATGSSTTGGAAAKSSSTLPKKSSSDAPPPAPVPPAPPGPIAKPRDWLASSITKPVEETRASPVKRSTGGFADEDDLFDIDEGFVEPPAKKAKSGAAPLDVAASEVSDLRGVISSLEAFASQYTSLEAEKVRLQKEVESSSSKLDGAVKIATEARQEADSLKEELGKLREKLREEEATRLAAEARAAEKDELLRQSSFALLEAANIPANALDKVPNNSPANGVSMTLASH